MNARILLFSLGGEYYAIDLDPVESILPEPEISKIPLQPSFFEGFFSYQGQCVPVLSLFDLLGARRSDEKFGGKILVLRHEGFFLAFRVDAVLGTRKREDLHVSGQGGLSATSPVEIEGQAAILLQLRELFAKRQSAFEGAYA